MQRGPGDRVGEIFAGTRWVRDAVVRTQFVGWWIGRVAGEKFSRPNIPAFEGVGMAPDQSTAAKQAESSASPTWVRGSAVLSRSLRWLRMGVKNWKRRAAESAEAEYARGPLRSPRFCVSKMRCEWMEADQGGGGQLRFFPLSKRNSGQEPPSPSPLSVPSEASVAKTRQSRWGLAWRFGFRQALPLGLVAS